MSQVRQEAELDQYRTLLEVPKEFKPGFGWTTIAGLIFCGLIMLPGAIYLGLMTGGNLGIAASWVTVILFMDIARRAMKPLNRQQLVVLLHAAHVMMVGNMFFPGGPMAHLIYRAYLVGSDAVRDAGMLGAFPGWFAPPFDSPAILERNILHPDWLAPIGIMAFILFIGLVKKYTLGYFFFRLTSDVEKLPFPLAPINAQGAMALAEADENEESDAPAEAERKAKKSQGEGPSTEKAYATPGKKKKKSERWKIFSLGAYIGIAFGILQVGVPAVSGLFLAKPFFLIPQPFIDTTTLTETFLPATPTGIALDAFILILGFVLPFWAVMGTILAVVITLILNPILFNAGVLQTWQPGMDTVNTTFSNNLDFWLSFNIGAGFGIAAVSIIATWRGILKRMREDREKRDQGQKRENVWAVPRQGRGDYPLWMAIAIYVVAAAAMVGLSLLLLPLSIQIVFFLIFFAFVYSPFISYVSARLIGISGQRVDIPYIKESAFLLSGAKGIEIWLAPVPVENFGEQAQAFRVNELTGVSFWSLIKTDLVAFPILFILSLTFWGFIWKSDPIPSEMFPAAQVNWEYQAKNQVLIYSSTFIPPGEDPANHSIANTEFMKAFHPWVIGIAFCSIVGLFGALSWAGLPIMLVYGLMRGFGQFPHLHVLELVGALLGRYYFRKKYGTKNFLLMAPTLLAGYMTGVGLIGMATVAMQLIKSAVSGLPF